jgi:hypothetical protein
VVVGGEGCDYYDQQIPTRSLIGSFDVFRFYLRIFRDLMIWGCICELAANFQQQQQQQQQQTQGKCAAISLLNPQIANSLNF